MTDFTMCLPGVDLEKGSNPVAAQGKRAMNSGLMHHAVKLTSHAQHILTTAHGSYHFHPSPHPTGVSGQRRGHVIYTSKTGRTSLLDSAEQSRLPSGRVSFGGAQKMARTHDVRTRSTPGYKVTKSTGHVCADCSSKSAVPATHTMFPGRLEGRHLCTPCAKTAKKFSKATQFTEEHEMTHQPTQFDELFKSDTCPTCGGETVVKANATSKENIQRGNKDSTKHAKPGVQVPNGRPGKKGKDGKQGKKTKIVGKSMDGEETSEETSVDETPAYDLNKAMFPQAGRFSAVSYIRDTDTELAKSIEDGDESHRHVPPARNLAMEQELALSRR